MGPMQIQKLTFDTGIPGNLSLTAVTASSTASWGMVTGKGVGGSTGLWCAGTRSDLWPTYPQQTLGDAELALPQLMDYYSSRIDFSYNMPSVGADDREGFDFLFRPDDSILWEAYYWFPVTGTSSYAAWGRDLSTGLRSLARKPGVLRFQFRDSFGNGRENPRTGRGPVLDDIVVSGYMFGKVRNLAGVLNQDGKPTISWQKPYDAAGSTQEDTRDLRYRVWRSTAAAPTSWTELTPFRISATSLTDTSAALGATYRYFVQPWEAGTGVGYGAGDPTVDVASVTLGLPPKAVTRLTASSRSATAVECSKLGFPTGAASVVIASAGAWPDALSASALAGQVRGPLLTLDASTGSAALTVPSGTMSEIARLGATTAYICGGTGVVSEAVASQLQVTAGLTVVRLGGIDRYDTSRLVAERVKALRGGSTGGTVFIATGANYPDALAASSLAAALKAPVILTKLASVDADPDTRLALNAIRPTRVVVCGGTGVVSSYAETQLRAYTTKIFRRSGATRYDTAKSIAEYGKTNISAAPKKIYVGNAADFADVLSGGVVAGMDGGWNPVLLTLQGGLPSQTIAFMNLTPSLHDGLVLGATADVSDVVKTQVLGYLH